MDTHEVSLNILDSSCTDTWTANRTWGVVVRCVIRIKLGRSVLEISSKALALLSLSLTLRGKIVRFLRLLLIKIIQTSATFRHLFRALGWSNGTSNNDQVKVFFKVFVVVTPKQIFGEVFFVGPLGLLVTSALGFKAREDPSRAFSLVWFSDSPLVRHLLTV